MSSNQSEKEFFALVAVGRKGVEDMLVKMGPEMRTIAAPNVATEFDTWTKRALVEVANRDELREVIQSQAGIFSVYKALTKAAQVGVQIGGQFPHVYLVPKQGKAVLVFTADGMAFASAHGPGAVLRAVPELVRVYEKDDFKLDKAGAVVIHKPDPFGDSGKLVGYYMRLEYIDGHVEIPTIRRAEVEDISKNYSTKEYSGGGKAPAWAKSPEAMFDKIAAKQLLKKPTKEAEGRAMLMSLDDYEPPALNEAPPRDVTERVSARLDAAAGSFDPEPVGSEPEPTSEPVKAAKPHEEKVPEPTDLF